MLSVVIRSHSSALLCSHNARAKDEGSSECKCRVWRREDGTEGCSPEGGSRSAAHGRIGGYGRKLGRRRESGSMLACAILISMLKRLFHTCPSRLIYALYKYFCFSPYQKVIMRSRASLKRCMMSKNEIKMLLRRARGGAWICFFFICKHVSE